MKTLQQMIPAHMRPLLLLAGLTGCSLNGRWEGACLGVGIVDGETGEYETLDFNFEMDVEDAGGDLTGSGTVVAGLDMWEFELQGDRDDDLVDLRMNLGNGQVFLASANRDGVSKAWEGDCTLYTEEDTDHAGSTFEFAPD